MTATVLPFTSRAGSLSDKLHERSAALAGLTGYVEALITLGYVPDHLRADLDRLVADANASLAKELRL